MPFVRSLYSPSRIIEGISITRAGRIGLPKYFIAKHTIHRGMRAHLYWDRRNLAMAISFVDVDDPTTWPILFTQRYGAFINANRFFRLNKIDVSQLVGRYRYREMSSEQVNIPDAQSDVFIIHLGDGQPAKRVEGAGVALRSEQSGE